MPKFEVRWSMEGTAEVEADDAEDAQSIVRDQIGELDTTLLESWEVTDVFNVIVERSND